MTGRGVSHLYLLRALSCGFETFIDQLAGTELVHWRQLVQQARPQVGASQVLALHLRHMREGQLTISTKLPSC